MAEDALIQQGRSRADALVQPVRHRQIIYFSGYDPRGPTWYYNAFARACTRLQQVYSARVMLCPLEVENDDLAQWQIETELAGRTVETSYDFIRFERFVSSQLAAATMRQIWRCLAWIIVDDFRGTRLRILSASWRFGIHLEFFRLLTAAWLLVPALAAYILWRFASVWLARPALAVAAAVPFGWAVLALLRPLADRWYLVQITNCWLTLRSFGRGRPTWLDGVIDRAAERVLKAVADSDADEIVVVGHSTGAVLALATVARVLERNLRLDGSGPHLVLLTLGSVMPGLALDRAAVRMRQIVKRVAMTPDLVWIDCQSRKDVMNFANFDP